MQHMKALDVPAERAGLLPGAALTLGPPGWGASIWAAAVLRLATVLGDGRAMGFDHCICGMYRIRPDN